MVTPTYLMQCFVYMIPYLFYLGSRCWICHHSPFLSGESSAPRSCWCRGNMGRLNFQPQCLYRDIFVFFKISYTKQSWGIFSDRRMDGGRARSPRSLKVAATVELCALTGFTGLQKKKWMSWFLCIGRMIKTATVFYFLFKCASKN